MLLLIDPIQESDVMHSMIPHDSSHSHWAILTLVHGNGRVAFHASLGVDEMPVQSHRGDKDRCQGSQLGSKQTCQALRGIGKPWRVQCDTLDAPDLWTLLVRCSGWRLGCTRRYERLRGFRRCSSDGESIPVRCPDRARSQQSFQE